MLEIRIIKDLLKIGIISFVLAIVGFYLDFNDWKEDTTLWNTKGDIILCSMLILSLISAIYFPIKYNKE